MYYGADILRVPASGNRNTGNDVTRCILLPLSRTGVLSVVYMPVWLMKRWVELWQRQSKTACATRRKIARSVLAAADRWLSLPLRSNGGIWQSHLISCTDQILYQYKNYHQLGVALKHLIAIGIISNQHTVNAGSTA